MNERVVELLAKMEELLLEAKIELGKTSEVIPYEAVKDARLILQSLKTELELLKDTHGQNDNNRKWQISKD